MTDRPLNEARQVAESTAVAIMGRISAYSGQVVRWSDIMEDSGSEFYNLAASPSPEAFELGDVVMPPERVIALPGDGEPIRRK